jgi:hypothetical protein
MLFIVNFYKNTRIQLNKLFKLFYYSFLLTNTKLLSSKLYTLLPINSSSIKINFFSSFFKDFLLWNYILNPYSKKQNTLIKKSINTKTHSKNNYTTIKLKVHNLLPTINFINILYNFMYYRLLHKVNIIVYKSFSFSWYYMHGFVFILFIDACLTDDEPLWEPIE